MLLCTFCAQAQVDSVRLDSVVVTLRGSATTERIEDVDQISVRHVGDLLTQRSHVYVKPNSGNGLSTISIRGGTAEQSTVFWNGLSLQNTLNGNLDLNLVPAVAFQTIDINNTQSTSVGSGAINGSLQLKNNEFSDSLQWLTHHGYGSFGQYNGHLVWRGNGIKTRHRVLLYHTQARNDYTYKPLGGSRPFPPPPLPRLEHAAFQNSGLMYAVQRRFKQSNPLNVRLWTQYSNREVPNSIIEGPSRKYQQDGSARLQADWSKNVGKSTIKVNAGSFFESLGYQDSASKIYSDYAFFNQSLLLHAKHRFSKKFALGFDLEFRHFYGDADTFYQVGRTELAQALHGTYTLKNTKFQASLRSVQYSNNSDRPVLYTLQLERRLTKTWKALAKYSTNYRMPTFNSLYWNPGGNPDLLSERSQNLDVNLLYNAKRWRARLTIYDYIITNQITWLPGSQGYFEAVQVAGQEQWNRGGEVSVRYVRKTWEAYANYSALKSTVKADSTGYFEGKQQLYVPEFQGNAGFSWHYRWLNLSGYTWYISPRRSNTYISHLGQSLIPGIRISGGVSPVTMSLQVDNLLNKTYFILPYRPNMPRSIQFSITYQIHKKDNT
jgi:iron complex outermembrane receptor protein